MVKRQFAGGILSTAVLTPVFVTSEDISAIQLDLASRQSVVK